jgi:hypothetical protein
MRFIAPQDGEHGGSWIGVNEFGMSLCLLNRYQDGEQSANKAQISRGLVLLDLMESAVRADVHNRISETDLSRFQPFTLVALEPQREVLLVHWTGRDCLIDTHGERSMPLTSSSYDSVGVDKSRKQCLGRLINKSAISAQSLFRFHASHEPTPGPYSTCMHREDARTVSFCQIKVTADEIEFCYHPLSPCSLLPDSGKVSTTLGMARTLR